MQIANSLNRRRLSLTFIHMKIKILSLTIEHASQHEIVSSVFPRNILKNIQYFQDIAVTPYPISTHTVTKSERKMSSVALIELHKSFEDAEIETKPETKVETEPKPTVIIPAVGQAQPSTPTVTSPMTPPASSSPVVKDAPAVGELKAVHDIPSTPPVGKTKGSAPAKSTAPTKPAKK